MGGERCGRRFVDVVLGVQGCGGGAVWVGGRGCSWCSFVVLTLPFHIGIRYGPLTQTACNMRGNTGRELYILSSGVNQTHDGQGQRWEPVILAQGPGCLAGVSVGDTRGGGHASKPRGSVACDRARYTLSHGRRFLQAPLGGRGAGLRRVHRLGLSGLARLPLRTRRLHPLRPRRCGARLEPRRLRHWVGRHPRRPRLAPVAQQPADELPLDAEDARAQLLPEPPGRMAPLRSSGAAALAGVLPPLALWLWLRLWVRLFGGPLAPPPLLLILLLFAPR